MEPIPTSKHIANAVRIRLRDVGKTQLDVVDATGIPRSTLSRRMTGNSPFTVTELELIAAFLDTSVTSLLVAAERAA